jgi:hypothetical protein
MSTRPSRLPGPARAAALAYGLLLGAPALAAGTPALLPPFQGEDPTSKRRAAELTAALAEAAALQPDLRVVPLSSVPAVGALPAPEYAASCPPGQAVGCAFVLGEAGGVSLAVSGAVRSSGGVSVVEVHIVDVPNSVDMISFTAEVVDGDAGSFGVTVAGVLASVARGEVGRGGDIRAVAVVPVDGGVDKEAAGRQLSQLEKEIGGAGGVDRWQGGKVERERVTEDDLMSAMESDGAKPWERIQMSPKTYMRYRNSGLSLMEWRKRELGRKGQLLIRPWLGYGSGPFSGAYRGAKGLDGTTLQTLETWAWHELRQSSAFEVGASVGYGILPELEVGFGLGTATGAYSLQTIKETEGAYSNPPEEQTVSNTVVWMGPELLFVPMVTSPVRPVGGLRFTWLRGNTVDEYYQIDPELPTFDPLASYRLGLIAGVEARMGDHIDLALHVPIDLHLGGTTSAQAQTGGGVLERAKLDQPGTFPTVAAGFQLALQIRALGAKVKASGPASDPDDDF